MKVTGGFLPAFTEISPKHTPLLHLLFVYDFVCDMLWGICMAKIKKCHNDLAESGFQSIPQIDFHSESMNGYEVLKQFKIIPYCTPSACTVSVNDSHFLTKSLTMLITLFY